MDMSERGEFKEINPNDNNELLKPDLRLSQFSKKQLARMYTIACECYYDSLEAWSEHVTLKYGFDTMIEAQHYHLVQDNI